MAKVASGRFFVRWSSSEQRWYVLNTASNRRTARLGMRLQRSYGRYKREANANRRAQKLNAGMNPVKS